MPIGVVALTAMFITELPEPGAGIGLGLKLNVVPDGTPEADRAIELLKPLLMVVLMVDVPWLPWTMVRDAGDAERVKLAGAVTVNVTVAVCCMPPPLPVTVMG